MIQFTDFCKRIGQHTILSDISLTIPDGERVAIIGPSGSGKSTLLRCINGLETFSGGQLEVMGVPLHVAKPNLRRLRQEVAMVFQGFHLFPHLTVIDNITLAPVHVRGREREEARAQAMQLLDRVGLPHKAHVYPAQLSGGQQQRVAIARALAMQPHVLLMDEPTSALDPKVTQDLLSLLLDLHEGRTMVMVTHELGFARRFADRILFLDHSRVVEDARAEELFDRPQSPQLKEFLLHCQAVGL